MHLIKAMTNNAPPCTYLDCPQLLAGFIHASANEIKLQAGQSQLQSLQYARTIFVKVDWKAQWLECSDNIASRGNTDKTALHKAMSAPA